MRNVLKMAALSFLIYAAAPVIFAQTAYAAAPTGDISQVEKFLESIQTLLIRIIIFGAPIALIWCGIRWAISVGDPEGVEKARTGIKGVLVGLAIAFSSLVIVGIFKQLAEAAFGTR